MDSTDLEAEMKNTDEAAKIRPELQCNNLHDLLSQLLTKGLRQSSKAKTKCP